MKECCGVVLALQHWRPYLWGKHFKCVTDHAALTHLCCMQDTSNMSTRWTIALQTFDFTVEHKPGKLRVVPDTLSRLFCDIPEDTTLGKMSLFDVLPSQPRLASICRNAPQDGQPYRPPTPRAYEVHSNNLNELCLVESDRELFTSIVSVFPTLDRESRRAETRIWGILQVFL